MLNLLKLKEVNNLSISARKIVIVIAKSKECESHLQNLILDLTDNHLQRMKLFKIMKIQIDN